MKSRIGVPVLGILMLTACAPHSSKPDGAVELDEVVQLARHEAVDVATRETFVDDGVLVAIVDEGLTDVRLNLSAVGRHAASVKPVEVENMLAGAGTEIAALEVPEGTRVVITLTGPQNAIRPGAVKLRSEERRVG